MLALACAVGFVGTFLVALHSAPGVRADDTVFRHVNGNTAFPVRAAGAARDLLLGIDAVFVLAALAFVVVLAVLRQQVARAAAALAIVVCSVGSAELVKHLLPHLPGFLPAGRAPSWPSGHTSIAVSLGLALVLAAPPVLRPAAALVGAAYAAGVGLSLILLGWHFPSDVVASFFLCGLWAAAIAAVLPRTVRRPGVSASGVAVAIGAVAVGLLVAAAVAGRHPGAVHALRSARSVVATAVALGVLSVALFGAFAAFVEEEQP
jgi:membrane-associated phospholipid phosphatase